MPEVSVVTPCFNDSAFLSGEIESVMNQTFQDLELIIVDDGSTDNTREIVEEYISRFPGKVKYVYQKNKGPGAARNTGIKNACGNYIALLDSDDLWHEEKLAVQLEFLKKNPQFDFVFCDAYAIDKAGKNGKSMMSLKSPVSGKIFFNLLKENFISSATPLAKKQCYEKVNYFCEDPGLIGAEDHHLWLKIAYYYEGGFINEPLAYYRIRRESLSGGGATSPVKGIDGQLLALDKIARDFPDAYHNGRRHFNRAKAILYYELGFALYRNNAFWKALNEFFFAIKEDFTLTKVYKAVLILLFVPHPILRARNKKISRDEAQLLSK